MASGPLFVVVLVGCLLGPVLQQHAVVACKEPYQCLPSEKCASHTNIQGCPPQTECCKPIGEDVVVNPFKLEIVEQLKKPEGGEKSSQPLQCVLPSLETFNEMTAHKGPRIGIKKVETALLQCLDPKTRSLKSLFAMRSLAVEYDGKRNVEPLLHMIDHQLHLMLSEALPNLKPKPQQPPPPQKPLSSVEGSGGSKSGLSLSSQKPLSSSQNQEITLQISNNNNNNNNNNNIDDSGCSGDHTFVHGSDAVAEILESGVIFAGTTAVKVLSGDVVGSMFGEQNKKSGAMGHQDLNVFFAVSTSVSLKQTVIKPVQNAKFRIRDPKSWLESWKMEKRVLIGVLVFDSVVFCKASKPKIDQSGIAKLPSVGRQLPWQDLGLIAVRFASTGDMIAVIHYLNKKGKLAHLPPVIQVVKPKAMLSEDDFGKEKYDSLDKPTVAAMGDKNQEFIEFDTKALLRELGLL